MSETRRDRFTTIYEAHYHRILGYARRRTDHESADDAVAETFTIAWRRLDEMPAPAELLWLYGVARRVLANQRRATVRRERLTRALGDEQQVVHTRPEDTGVAAAFRALPGADRELLSLVAWEDLSPKEVAAVVGISANAARIRIHRARRRLARELADAEPASPRPRVTLELEDHA